MAPSISDCIPAGWSGYKFNLISVVADYAIDVKSRDDGIEVHAWEYNESNENQVWELKLVNPYANVWTLRSTVVDHYLEIGDGASNNGAAAHARSAKGSSDTARHNQEWYIYIVNGAGGNARIALQNVMSGSFLNLSGSESPRNGTKIQGYDWDATNNCVWRLVQQL